MTVLTKLRIGHLHQDAGDGEAKPLVAATPFMMNVLMPTSSPFTLTSGPPLLPWLIGASVWM